MAISALRRQRQVELCKFEASLVYTEQVPGQTRLHREILTRKTKTKQKNDHIIHETHAQFSLLLKKKKK